MLSRRAFVGRGLAAVALGSFATRSLGFARGGGVRLVSTRPLLPIEPDADAVVVRGIPFAPRWFGDTFGKKNYLPFHQSEIGPDTPPDETVDIAIVGGGLSGLSAAYHLRDRKPVVFDLRSRFGGNCMGEDWDGIAYSQGSAYFIVPDKGDSLDTLYRELGVYERAAYDTGPFVFLYENEISTNPCLAGCTPPELEAVACYQGMVEEYASRYPDIPLPDKDDAWIRELDQVSLRASIEGKCGTDLPKVMREAIQAYCYSSFGVSWEEISAAAGWNFISAEEFGRIVLPGGNCELASLLWDRLRELDSSPDGAPGSMLRAGHIVTSVELVAGGKVLVRYRDANGTPRAMLAKHVICANAKHIVERMLLGLERRDPDKFDAIQQVQTAAYLVANVLLDTPVEENIYDLFLLGDTRFPMTPEAFEKDRRICDAVAGAFALKSRGVELRRDVLTLYWPLPWHAARFSIVEDNDWMSYAELAAPQITTMLEKFGRRASDVRQVRLTRWGHAMPYAQPGQIGGGIAECARRPIEGQIWFVNQDNWLLPAVETCLLEAETYAAQIRDLL